MEALSLEAGELSSQLTLRLTSNDVDGLTFVHLFIFICVSVKCRRLWTQWLLMVALLRLLITLSISVAALQQTVTYRKKCHSALPKVLKPWMLTSANLEERTFLKIATKITVYQAVILPILLYGAETWTAKSNNIRRLDLLATSVKEGHHNK